MFGLIFRNKADFARLLFRGDVLYDKSTLSFGARTVEDIYGTKPIVTDSDPEMRK